MSIPCSVKQKRQLRFHLGMWPVLFKGRSMVAVSRPKTKKTVGYLLPLLQSLLTKSDYPLPPDEGPLAIILSPTRKKAADITAELEKLSQSKYTHFLSLCF